MDESLDKVHSYFNYALYRIGPKAAPEVLHNLKKQRDIELRMCTLKCSRRAKFHFSSKKMLAAERSEVLKAPSLLLKSTAQPSHNRVTTN
jgi:hypothetical protein